MDRPNSKGAIMTKDLRLRLSATAAAGGLALLFGCSTQTTTTDVWKDKSYASGPVKNVVVFGQKLDPTQRRSLEDAFVSALAPHAVHATQSYTLFPGGATPSKDDARAVIQRNGYDGVIVATARGTSERASYVAEDGFWDGYYGVGWAGSPGYVVTDSFVKFETTMWDPAGKGKMIWSATTQTENPTSGQDFVASLLKSVIPSMSKAGIIPPAGTAMFPFEPTRSPSMTASP
jgi:hypothetical protein